MQKTKQLFILLHGEGECGTAMAVTATQLRQVFPQAAFALPDGPITSLHREGAAEQSAAYLWLPAAHIAEPVSAAERALAINQLHLLIQREQARFGLAAEAVALVGYSQGALLALEYAQAQPGSVGRVIALNGRFLQLPTVSPGATVVHWIHGKLNTQVPTPLALQHAEQLQALQADFTFDVLPFLDHDLAPQLIARAIQQLTEFVPRRLWEAAMRDAPPMPAQK